MCKNSGWLHILHSLKNGMAYSKEQGQGTTYEITAYKGYSLRGGNSQHLFSSEFQKSAVFRLLNYYGV